jgi:hypothetical protein
MRKVFKRLAPALIHVLAWLGFIVYEQSTFFLTGTPPPSYFFILILYPLNALLFYGISEGLLPRIADKRPYWQAMLAVPVGAIPPYATQGFLLAAVAERFLPGLIFRVY